VNAIIPWRDVDVWYADSDGRTVPAGSDAHRRLLREYRDTGGIDFAYLADPSDVAEDDDSIVSAGPSVDAIDWTGIDDEAQS
jgi:hypothetical protein